MPTLTADAVLRAAADYLDAHPEKWSRAGEWIDSDGCRCAGGVISLIVDPDDRDGDPYLLSAAYAAVQLFEDYVYGEVIDRLSPDGFDGPVIGAWNDKIATGAAHVAETMRAAADPAQHPSNPDQLLAHAMGVCWHSPTADRFACQADPR